MPGWYTPPMLYWIVAPTGAITTIVPVGVVHDGCMVTEAVGAAGAAGIGFTVKTVAIEIQPVVMS